MMLTHMCDTPQLLPSQKVGVSVVAVSLPRCLLLSPCCSPMLVGGAAAGAHAPPASQVDAWAGRQWEALQLCLLKGQDGAEPPEMPDTLVRRMR